MFSNDSERKKKGFSGLSNLVSDISTTNDHASVFPGAGISQPPMPKAPEPQPKETHSQYQHKRSSYETVSTDQGSRNPGWKLLLGIVGAIGFIVWTISNTEPSTTNQRPHATTTPSQTYTEPQSRPEPIKIDPSDFVLDSHGYNNPQSRPVRGAPTTTIVQPPEVRYEQPSVGTSNILSVAQICWCLREDIRIETIRPTAVTNADIEAFNRLIDDYNSRCGSFRYREGSLERAKRAVEAQRSEIVAEAVRNFGLLEPLIPGDDLPSRPNARDTRETQEILTELGYDPGPIDGDFGRFTHAAIIRFQADLGLEQTGTIDEDLLSALRAVREEKHATAPDRTGVIVPRRQIAPPANGIIPIGGSLPKGKVPAGEPVPSVATRSDSITEAERKQIEDYCARSTVTPGDEYNCIKHELQTLERSGGRPDLSGISRYCQILCTAERTLPVVNCSKRPSPAFHP